MAPDSMMTDQVGYPIENNAVSKKSHGATLQQPSLSPISSATTDPSAFSGLIPGAPTNLTATASGYSVINLSWGAAPPASNNLNDEIQRYLVETSTNGNAQTPTWTQIAILRPATRTYSHTGRSAATTYWYRVRARDRGFGLGPYSTIVSVTTGAGTAPSVPRNLTATPDGKTTINLKWTAPSNTGGLPCCSYQVQVSNDGSTGWADQGSEISSGVTYSHTGLSAGTTRHYRVQSKNSAGTSTSWSNVAQATTLSGQPGPPTALRAVHDGPNRVILNWTAPSSTGDAGITGYRIRYGLGTTFTHTINTTGTSTTYTHTGLSADQRVRYRVQAVNSFGAGNPSNTVTVNLPSLSAPASPKALTATADGETTINLSWTAPTNTGGLAITGYKIEVSDDGGATFTDLVASQSTTSYSHTGLSAGDTRHYRVSAINSRGPGPPATVSATTRRFTVPGPPEALDISEPSYHNMYIFWLAPSNNGGRPITGYHIEWSTNGTTWTVLVDDTESTLKLFDYYSSLLTPGNTFYYRVSAINAVGISDPSNVVMATAVNHGTGRPTSLTASITASSEITVSWSPPSNLPEGQSVLVYRVWKSENDGDSWELFVVSQPGSETSTSDSGPFTAGATYGYRAAALGPPEFLLSDMSDEVYITYSTVPDAPTGLSATADGQTTIDLEWTAPTNTGGAAITGYRIEVSTNSGNSFTNLVANTGSVAITYSHTGLNAGTRRDYRVSAINSAGTGPPSNVDDATTDAATAPDAPTNLSATADGQTTIDLEWTAPTNTGGAAITGYRIEVSTNSGSSFTNLVANTGSVAITYSHTGLNAGTRRDYRVSAINSAGTGSASTPAHATTASATAPDAPTDLSATADGQTAIDLSWTAPASDGGTEITGYRIEVSPNGTSNWTNQVANTGNANTSYSHTGLSPGTTRHYRVSAINTAGIGAASNVDDATTDAATAPTAPRSLTANASGQTIINLNWTAPASNGGADISGYRIEVSTNGGSSFSQLVASQSTTTYSHTGLSAGTARHYRVRAMNTAGNSAWSNTANATTATPTATAPGAPTSLTATADGPTTINLAWEAPSSTGGADITGYNIEVSATGQADSWSDLVANTRSTSRSYADTGLNAVTTRYYRVRAINAAGTGAASNEDDATTAAATAPGAPTDLSATADGQTTIDLSWTAPTNTGGVDITGYRIEVSPNGTSNWTNQVANTGDANTSYSHTGLTAGTTRHYRVSAINTVGTGTASNVATATTATPTVTAPGAPTGLTATADGQTTIDLEWTAPTNTGGAPITGYQIEFSTNSGSSFSNLVANTGSAATTYSHTGLTAGTRRDYRVSAINSAGSGSASTAANATTATATAPDAPTGLSATADGQTTIDLEWTAPTNTGGSAITGYNIEISTDGGTTFSDLVPNTSSTSTTYAHTGLTGGTTRHYRVRAINTVDVGPPSNVANATTAASTSTAPGAPTSLSATADGPTNIDLSWTAPANTGGATITGYNIEISTDGGTNFSDLVPNTSSTSTSYAHTGLSAGTTRHYRVRAINTVDVGPPSNVANATTDASVSTAPDAPTALTATASERTTINLSWTAPSDNGGASITGYQIEVSPDGTSGWSDLVPNTGSTTTTYTHTGLDPSSTRSYRIRAINSAGTSDASNIASATTEAASVPDAPTGLTATTSENNSVILSWTAPADDGGSPITGYQIDRSPDGIADWENLIANTGSTLTTYTLTNLAPDSPHYFRVTAINSLGDSAPSDAVEPSASNPLSLGTSVDDQFYPIGLLITDLVLPEALGGMMPYTYALTPSLPEGLTLNLTTRIISGTPSKTTMQTTYTWEVKDADGNTADQEFGMEVYDMSFTQTVTNQSYPRAQPIPALVLPEATGGKDPIQYSLTLLTLPSGLSYSASTRTVSGTPSVVTMPTPMTYKAVDAFGAQDSLTFTIEVVSPVHSEVETGLPQHLKVQSNYPNPFVHATNLVFDLPWSAEVKVQVLDVTGRQVYTKPPIRITAGWNHELTLDRFNLPSGAYLYRLIATSLDSGEASVHVGRFMRVQ